MTTQVKDPKHYPALRNLQFSPLKQGDEQYILLWDPSRLSHEKLVIPLPFFFLFQFFDGEHSLEQLGAEYLKKYGEFLMPDKLSQLVTDLDDKLFLEGERFEQAKAAAVTAYRQGPVRKPVYAGKSYEADPEQLRKQIDSFFDSKEGPEQKPSEHQGARIQAIVAPNVEPKEAGPIYAWAYKELREAVTPDVFVVIGTCHTELAHGIAMTDKDFETPLGVIPSYRPILDHVRTHGGAMFFDDDIRHEQEHSIEFQLPFLQHAIGSQRQVSIVPVLCSFPPDVLANAELKPLFEDIDAFLVSLKEAITASGQHVCVIGSASLAHIGLRYGDNKPPTDFSFHRCMQTDLEMLKKVEEMKPEEFAQFILTEGDARHIMGFSTIFLLMKLIEAEKGEVLRYDRGITDQFNSTVTYASISFF
ncbi:MAG: AmmeMemoRadiSam system protein B [Nitrospirales bacterium]|nr:AmmeMemoRadiSam system protein B [Nitrospira sp.]MDR4503055.1 AmmeMemoRadiSam system protein B [Nitrospirales bacterium]